MSKTWSGLTTREYKKYKGLTKENLRDNMTNMELLLNALEEETATELSKQRNPEGLSENTGVAKEGVDVAKTARKEVEKRLGHSVISREKAIDHIKSPEESHFLMSRNRDSKNGSHRISSLHLTEHVARGAIVTICQTEWFAMVFAFK